MKVLINQKLLDRIKDLLLETYPYEGCGFLLGLKNQENLEIFDCYPVENAWPKVEERRRRFAINPKDYLLAEKVAESKGLSLVGVYHSHPNYQAVPSAFDAECAWEGYVYLIFSLSGHTVKDIRAYVWEARNGFEEVRICLQKT